MRLISKKEFKKPESFDELLQDDPFGLLANVGEKRLSMSVSDKIKAAFEEIADFVKSNQSVFLALSDTHYGNCDAIGNTPKIPTETRQLTSDPSCAVWLIHRPELPKYVVFLQ